MGSNDSDSALSGLAGYNIVEKGERPMFRYGLHYIGTLLPHAAALPQILTGPSPIVQRLIHLGMYTGFIFLIWLLGRRLFGEKPSLAAAAFATVPPFAVMQHIRHPEFVETLFWGTLSFVILAKAVAEKSTRARPLFLYGLVSGILFYAHLQ